MAILLHTIDVWFVPATFRWRSSWPTLSKTSKHQRSKRLYCTQPNTVQTHSQQPTKQSLSLDCQVRCISSNRFVAHLLKLPLWVRSNWVGSLHPLIARWSWSTACGISSRKSKSWLHRSQRLAQLLDLLFQSGLHGNICELCREQPCMLHWVSQQTKLVCMNRELYPWI